MLDKKNNQQTKHLDLHVFVGYYTTFVYLGELTISEIFSFLCFLIHVNEHQT
jgi:hypothetical protein